MLKWHGDIMAKTGLFRGTKPHVKTNCELASSHSEERGRRRVRGREKGKKKRERRGDATKINSSHSLDAAFFITTDKQNRLRGKILT